MVIYKYQESWVTDFNRIKTALIERLSNSAINIEHVGSTSIKHLAAKPIIDIDLIYDELAQFAIIKEDLEKLGYYHNGDQGIAGREVFKRKASNTKHPIFDFIKHHLYVCQTDNKELNRHLSFRNHLRANDQARQAYEQLKYNIAELAGHDHKKYVELKEVMATDFIESILDRNA